MRPIKGTVNYVELIGWLGSDPEERFTPSGIAIANFSLATKRYGARQEDGSWLYETDWIDVEAIDKLAETVTANLQKGSRVRVTGSLRTDTWQDREGNPRKRLFVRADDVLFLDARTSPDDAVVAEASQ
ncbi:MAG TPA: single-stranded DNA-binding protein [Herpetosiphonaceae bacterium]|nr:single-stranded DNA-binding protein [Herpetosiphonaceae bacterium]